MDRSLHALPPESLSALAEAATAITSTIELAVVLETIARLAREVSRAEASTVFSFDRREDQLHVVAATGNRREMVMGREFPARIGIPGQVVRTGRPIILDDARTNGRFAREIDDIGTRPTRALMAAPMIHRAEVIGVVEVVNRLDGTNFHDTDLKVLQIFATLAASATQNARAHEDLRRRYEGLRDRVSQNVTVIGESPPLKKMLELCHRVAPSNATVLLLGETGTGKEVAARYVHSCSKRRQETFAAVNCAALTETLLESELFGHERGAFTGAASQHIGWFELADKGTLFLDEIGDISRSTQAKLLRVLQEKEFVRVGGTKAIACDVRIIAATNRNLKNMMIDGLFREDLYYRLSVFPVQVPPLRERREDIPILVNHFVKRAIHEFRIPELRVLPETLSVLERYTWPGNIRELQNVVERAVLMSEGSKLLPEHLPPDMVAVADSEGVIDAGNALAVQERSLILKALEDSDWNQSQTARNLGITRDHLRHRIKKYNLVKPGDEPVAQP